MIARLAICALGASLLAACGGAEDASDEAAADTVEVPANAALEGIDAMPVADPDANTNVTSDPASSTPPSDGPQATPSEAAEPAPEPAAEPNPEAAPDDSE